MGGTHKDFIHVKIFVDLSSQKEAHSLAKRIAKVLDRFGIVKVGRVLPYWKIKEYFEISLEIYSQEDIDRVAYTIGDGWEPAGSSLIWNCVPGSSFVEERVKWSSIERIPELRAERLT